jgi:hypothetical protein
MFLVELFLCGGHAENCIELEWSVWIFARSQLEIFAITYNPIG